MKKIIPILLLLVLCVSCDGKYEDVIREGKNQENTPGNEPGNSNTGDENKGEEFVRATGLNFSYVDERGNDLLNPKKYPLLRTFLDRNAFPAIRIDDEAYHNGYYQAQYNINRIVFNNGRYTVNTLVPGFKGKTEQTFYIGRSATDYDTLRAEFTFTSEGFEGGTSYAVINAVYFNGTFVYSDNFGEENSMPSTLVTVVKSSATGKTLSVSSTHPKAK